MRRLVAVAGAGVACLLAALVWFGAPPAPPTPSGREQSPLFDANHSDDPAYGHRPTTGGSISAENGRAGFALQGVVVDQVDQPVARATVRASGGNGSCHGWTTTDLEGQFQLDFSKPCDLHVFVTARDGATAKAM